MIRAAPEPENCCNYIDDDWDGHENGHDPDCQHDTFLSKGFNDICWWTEYNPYVTPDNYSSGWFTCPGYVEEVRMFVDTTPGEDLLIIYGDNGYIIEQEGFSHYYTADLRSENTTRVRFEFENMYPYTQDPDGVQILSITCSATQITKLAPYLVSPVTSITVPRNGLFNVTTGVRCVNVSVCRNIVATLDPVEYPDVLEPKTADSNSYPDPYISPDQNSRTQQIQSVNMPLNNPVNNPVTGSITMSPAKRLEEEYKTNEYVNVVIRLTDNPVQGLVTPASSGSSQLVESKQELLAMRKSMIKEHQDSVLLTLSANDFGLKYRYTTSNLLAGKLSREGYVKLKNNPDVMLIAPDEIMHAMLTESIPLINADDAWQMQVNGVNITGSGQTVCVVDSGINASHTGFGNRVLAEYCYCSVSDHGSGGCCPNNAAEDSSAMDDDGHGTHCAGIVAADYNQYKGVAYGANLVGIKVLNSTGAGWTSEILNGIDWCIDHSYEYNISVISLSLGGVGIAYTEPCDGDSIYTGIIDDAVYNGIFVVAASGNDGYTDALSDPACVTNAVSVGAVYDSDVGIFGSDITTEADKITYFTNRAYFLDLLAPGAIITSLNYQGGLLYQSGTSQACPHVAGAAALVQNYYDLKYNLSLSPVEVKQILINHGMGIYDSGSGLTFPRIDINMALSKGAIPMRPDWDVSDPFYTISNNPQNDSCLVTLLQGETCNQTWIINATGGSGTFKFFTEYSMGYHDYVISPSFSVTIDPGEDLTPPAVSLNRPWDGHSTRNSLISFNCSAYDNIKLANVTLYGNWSGWHANETNSAGINDADYLFTKILPVGGYSWNCYACDNNSNCAFSDSNRTFTIDIAAPTVNLESPANNTLENNSRRVIFKYNASDDNLIKNCSLIINDQIRLTDKTVVTDVSTNFSIILDNGNLNWSVNCSDYAGNTGSSFDYNLTVNSTQEVISINLVHGWNLISLPLEL